MTDLLERNGRCVPLRTLLDTLEARTPAELRALSADVLAEDLDVLVWTLLALHAATHRTTHALQAKRELLHVALRHEDGVVERHCLQELAQLQTELPVAEAAYQRCLAQWHRYWQALLRYRMPETLHADLTAIAAAEHR